jgi:hypothetical protein
MFYVFLKLQTECLKNVPISDVSFLLEIFNIMQTGHLIVSYG